MAAIVIRPDEVAPCRPTTHCKVCNASASLYGVTDFNKSCEEQKGHFLPLAGVPLYYHQCNACGLVFTEALDHWTKRDYLTHIYNNRYVDVDPDYLEVRPKSFAGFTGEFLNGNKAIRHLDYGCGNGTLSAVLKAQGWNSATWDPMDEQAAYPEGRFDVVTAFEVFEHTPEPRATVDEVMRFCNETMPLVFFSTYTIDQHPPRDIGFWYVAPRNGHVTVYTEASLQALFQRVGVQVHHFGNGFHLAYRSLPPWIDLLFFKRFEHHESTARRGLRKLRRIARRLAGH